MTEHQLSEIRNQVRQRRGDRKCGFRPELRERIATWCLRRREQGAFWTEIARDVGVPAQTLKRWMTSVSRPLAMKPVEIVAGHASSTVSIVTPAGVRVEGVTLDQAITILRGLTP